MAEPVRVATFNAELQRDGPGLFLRDIVKGEAADIAAAAALIADSTADVIALQGIDWDHGGVALEAFAGAVEAEGAAYPFRFAGAPNSGRATDWDLDGDGYKRGARDAEGFGAFAGQGGMAVLSKWPVTLTADFTGMAWADLEGALLTGDDPGAEARRLSSVAHWVLTVAPEGEEPFAVMTFHASPPVFDGPEDLNGRRNHDEIALWTRLLDGGMDVALPAHFVVMGDANADPADGDGIRAGIVGLLGHPALRDPAPASETARALAERDGGANATQAGDPALDTANWSDDGPGNLRVDYVLPSRTWRVTDAGVLWSETDDDGVPLHRHGLVWVDLDR